MWASGILIARLGTEGTLFEVLERTSECSTCVNTHIMGNGDDAANLLNAALDLIERKEGILGVLIASGITK